MFVYIIDEERQYTRSIASRLRLDGHSSMVFSNATEALRFFEINEPTASNEIRFLIDVALAPGEDVATFDYSTTQNFYLTGVVLAKILIRKYPKIFSGGIATLYTAHHSPLLWGEISKFCSENNLKCVQKTPSSDAKEVLNWLGK